MSYKSTRVVLLGRRSEDGESLTELLGSIFPTELPIEFIHQVNLIFENGQITEVPPSKLKKSIKLEEPSLLLKELGIKNSLETMEIVIDLSTIQHKITEESTLILKKIIDDN